jgi:hypothetical protein
MSKRLPRSRWSTPPILLSHGCVQHRQLTPRHLESVDFDGGMRSLLANMRRASSEASLVYRGINRPGSRLKRCSHSRPRRRIQRGARRCGHATNFRLPPIPIPTLGARCSRHLFNQISCRGAPNATRRIPARLVLIRCTIAADSLSSLTALGDGLSNPRIVSPHQKDSDRGCHFRSQQSQRQVRSGCADVRRYASAPQKPRDRPSVDEV